MTIFGYAAYGYIAFISLVSIIVCAVDKRLAKIEGARRVPEITLIALCAFGGSVAMLFTMLLIHHKTQKAKFMIGVPVIIILQFSCMWWVAHFLIHMI